MNLENLETKEPLIKNFFTWLFDDERIVNKDVTLESEIDLVLSPYYMDANIYYPKQIVDFFNTKAMKRLGRVSQLDLAIDEYDNVYHNRLEHSKGVYYRKLEEMLHNFQNPIWKKKIEDNDMKLYLFAELIKMAGHDIGHLPLSHALEIQILSQRGAHEIIGRRIMLEDPEIQAILTSISPELPNTLKNLYEKHILNFQEHDESSYDVDRLDYIFRDNLYAGNDVYTPFLQYETIPVAVNAAGQPEINNDGSILVSDSASSTIDVYDYSSLHDIEHFLEIRESGYINIYFFKNTHIRENTLGALFKVFLSSDSKCGKKLREFVSTLRCSDLNTVDLSLFLEWDDLTFYSEILDIAENHEDNNVRLLATMTIPNMNAFLTMLYSHLNLYNKDQDYTDKDKQFLLKIKQLIKGQSPLCRNLRTPNFAMDNTIVFPESISFSNYYKTFIDKGFINSSTGKVKAYNSKDPIYIKGANGKIYELSNHPDRKCDWHNRITYITNTYAYIPFLRSNGLSENEIDDLINFNETHKQSQNIDTSKPTINMQPLQVGHKIEDKFFEI